MYLLNISGREIGYCWATFLRVRLGVARSESQSPASATAQWKQIIGVVNVCTMLPSQQQDPAHHDADERRRRRRRCLLPTDVPCAGRSRRNTCSSAGSPTDRVGDTSELHIVHIDNRQWWGLSTSALRLATPRTTLYKPRRSTQTLPTY